MSKKHPLKSTFSKAFGLIFRQDEDIQQVRKKETPQQPQIMKNLKDFVKKCQFQRMESIQSKTLKSI